MVVVVGVGWGWVSRGGGRGAVHCPFALPFKNINKYVSMRGKKQQFQEYSEKNDKYGGFVC